MPRFFPSTKSHRSLQRGNGMLDILGDGAQNLSRGADIPVKTMQALLSAYSLVNQELHLSEKAAQGLQLILAATSVGLSIALLFQPGTCNSNGRFEQNTTNTGDNNITPNFTLCTVAFIINMVYKGVLLASWAPGEVSKKSESDDVKNAPTA